MKNAILGNGFLILAGALALSACGGRDQQPTAPPEWAEPAPPPDTEGQDTTAQENAMPPEQGVSEHGMPRHEPPPGQILPEQQPVAAGPCPIDVQGTSARIEERPEGIAIAFTTTGDAPAVRLRVQRLADLHNQRHSERMQAMQEQAAAEEQARADAAKAKTKKGKTKRAKGAKAGEGQPGAQPGDAGQTAQTEPGAAQDAQAADVIARSHARVEETPDGATLVLGLMDPAMIESMREPLRAHADILAGPQCDPMSETNIPPGATSQRAPQPRSPR